jgi:hypothetical protein
MKRLSWEVLLGLSLVLSSLVLYIFHYMIFGDIHHILIYMVGDLAFLPIEVLVVTLIIHRLLGEREKRTLLEKLNMVVGAFFSEVGTGMLTYLSDFDPELEEIRKDLVVTQNWSDQDFSSVSNRLRGYDYHIDAQGIGLQELSSYLRDKRNFMLRLLENPTILEHESFTGLLRSVFHLTEELTQRGELKHLPETDLKHLAGDIERVYSSLVYQWLDYMRYLKDSYPYLFSLALRTNPFDQNASLIVK